MGDKYSDFRRAAKDGERMIEKDGDGLSWLDGTRWEGSIASGL
jgi:hypothetical protein